MTIEMNRSDILTLADSFRTATGVEVYQDLQIIPTRLSNEHIRTIVYALTILANLTEE